MSGRVDAPEAHAHLVRCAACQEIAAALARDARAVVRSPAEGERVGRYRVESRLGAGAMGVVYAAVDPELGRRVALKLVRADAVGERADRLRERLLREAQAMARVAHPNVITVHDVGALGDQVFLAMELVEGGTLGEWLRARPRDTGDIMRVFVQAGRGLEAAHRAGILHRDFKLDNVLVGSDGRVRVTDFGLARGLEHEPAEGGDDRAEGLLSATLTRTGAALGTPAYMPPEQLAGLRTDERADVYSYSVALFEALHGERPFRASSIDELRVAIASGPVSPAPSGRRVPRWLDRVVRRGLAARPEDRWPSMTALLSVIEARPRRARALAAAVGAALAVGVVASAVVTRGPPPCTGAAEAWGGAWDARADAQLRTAFRASGGARAEAMAAQVAAALDARREAWVAMRTEACVATRVRGEQSEALLDRRLSCLDDRRREVAALVSVLERADVALVDRAGGALAELRPLELCANARALGAPPVLSADDRARRDVLAAELAQARALHVAGRYDEALTMVSRGATLAATLGDPRLLGELLVERGVEEEEHFRYRDAEATYHHAARVALRSHDDAVLADVWIRLIGLVGYRFERAEESHLWAGFAEAAVENLGGDAWREARVFERLSLVEWAIEAKLVEARAHYLRARSLVKGRSALEAPMFLDEEHGGILTDMGLYDRALSTHAQVMRRVEETFGREHTEFYYAGANYGESLALAGRPAEAVPLLTEVVDRFGATIRDGFASHRLAEAYRRLGDAERALARDREAMTMLADDADSLDAGFALTGLGVDLWMLGRSREALPYLEHAARIRARVKLPTTVADTQWALARALWDSGGDRARASALAGRAEDAFATAAKAYGSPAFAARATEIAAWRGGHR